MAERLRAAIQVKLNGRARDDLDDEAFSVVVDSNLHLPAMATVELFDNKRKWVDDADIALGKSVEVTFQEQQGTESSDAPIDKLLFQGEITSIEPRYTADNQATLLFRAYDKSHRLHRGKQSRTFLDMKDSDIVSKIAQDAGLTAEVDATSITFEYVIQANQTDMEFLRERAQRIGYWAFATKEKLYFKKATSTLSEGGVEPELSWPENLREFRPRLSGVGQPASASADGWNFKTMKEFEGKATTAAKFNPAGVTQAGGAAAEAAFGGGSANVAVVQRPMLEGEATELAQAALNEAASEYLQADGECFGQADMMAGTTVKVTGVGTKFEGKYLVTSATHLYRNGVYLTRFTSTGRQPNTFRSLVAGNGHSGVERPQMALYGVVLGVVTSAEDKDSLGRIKVKFPWLPKSKGTPIDSAWARVAAPMAGKDRGFMFLPAVNDEVLVAFEHGDPNSPYILGGLWNSKNTPPLAKADATKEGKTQQHMIKTQAGHLFIFDDTSGKEQIVIRDKSTKNEIIINTKDNTILINADKDIKLTAKGNISFTATQDLLFDGANFKVSTKQDATFDATNAKVNAKANLTLAGLKIDAQGKTGVNLATAGLGKIEISPAKTSINAGGLDVM